jgi:tRNA U34 5-methylaminomethyl-2-thiouridine-forming methyltransferase MnmC
MFDIHNKPMQQSLKLKKNNKKFRYVLCDFNGAYIKFDSIETNWSSMERLEILMVSKIAVKLIDRD